MADVEIIYCRFNCKDKQGRPRTVPPGRTFKICDTCIGSLRRNSKKKSGEVQRQGEQLQVQVARNEMVQDGGKDKNGKLDPNKYLGQLKLKRQRMKRARVVIA